MASTPLCRLSASQSGDRSNKSGSSCISSKSINSGNTTGNTKGGTPLTNKVDPVSLPIRSAAERRTALLRSGLIRHGHTSPLIVSSARPPAAVLPAEHVSANASPDRSERCSRQAIPVPSPVAKGEARGTAGRQQRTLTRQQQCISSPTTPQTRALQSSSTFAGEGGTTSFTVARTERALVGSRKSNAETETAAAAAAFLASITAVPPQLLAPLGAVAGPPYPDISPVYLVCRCCKEKDNSARAVAAVEGGRAPAAAAAETAFCPALKFGSFREQLPGKAQQVWRGRETHQPGELQLKESKPSTATPEETAVEEVVGRGCLLQERVTLRTFSAEAGDGIAMTATSEDPNVQGPAAASARLTGWNCRAASLPPQNRTRGSGDACEATAVDVLSAALWRTVTGSPARTLSHMCMEDDVLQLQLGDREQREMLQKLHAVGRGERRKRRLEQRDARVISGSLQAALAAACATVLRVPGSDISDCCRRVRGATHAVPAAENQCGHAVADGGALHRFCLPCAAQRYSRKLLALPSHSFAAACFIIPRRTMQVPLPAGTPTRRTLTAGRCDKRAEERSDTLACDANSSSNSNSYTKSHSDGLDRASAASVRHSMNTEARTCYCRRAICFCCGCESGGGYCCRSRRDRDWTCRAVYIHLGVLYTAADVAASATAAAAGKQPRDARTTAAAARAAHTEAPTTDGQALGSVLLRRALLSSLTAPLRAQLVLQRHQKRQAKEDRLALHASDDRRPQTHHIPEHEYSLRSPAAEAAAPHQDHASPEEAGMRYTCLLADRDVYSYFFGFPAVKQLHPDRDGRRSEDEQTPDDDSSESEDTECVTVCCFDGIEQLQVRQWKQAAGVLSCALSEVAKAAVVSTAQTKAALEIKQKTAGGRGDDCSVPGPSEAKIGSDTGERAGLAAAANLQARPVGGAAASDTAEGQNTGGAASVIRGVVLLLLWRRSQLTPDASTMAAVSTAAAKIPQKGLWEEVSEWQQEVRGMYPGVQILLLSDEEDVQTQACLDMLQYLTTGGNHRGTKRGSAGMAPQQPPRDFESSELRQQVRGLLKEERRQRKQESEAEVHQQGQKEQGQKEQRHRRASHNSLQLGEQGQRQETREHRSVGGTSEDGQQGGLRHFQRLSDNAHRAVANVRCAPVADRARQSIPTTAATVDTSGTEATERAASARRQRHVHEGSGATRPCDGRRRTSKKTLRPCMLFLCGRSFMAAPSLSESRQWREVKSCFPQPLQHFVHELEDHVYVPMMLRARFGTANIQRIARSETARAAVRSSGVAAAKQDRSVLLQAHCERLLRWGDELLPPPRVLVHSCDLRGRCRRVASVPSGTLTQQQYPSKHGTAVPPDGGFSPQQVLQLVGERYSREVQTFLLPVAALASSFVGETEEKLRRLLREAAAAAPAVLVLLGLDQLAARRQLHKLPACKQLRTHTICQRENKQSLSTHPSNSVPRHHEEVETLRQFREEGRQHPSRAVHAETPRKNKATRGVGGQEESAGDVRLGERVEDNERSPRKQAGEVRQNAHTASRVSDVCSGRLASNEGACAAGSTRSTTARGENNERRATGDPSESESAEEYEGSDNEELPGDSRSGAPNTSALRRRLLAALLVGLDDIEDRRSCCSALLSLDDPYQTTTAGKTNDEVVAEASVAREWLQQQAGLAVVGVCGGRPEWLDEAVVRAGRLDVWLSWPQCWAGRKGDLFSKI